METKSTPEPLDEKHVRTLLWAVRGRTICPSHTLFPFLKNEIMARQPQWKEKLDTIQRFKIILFRKATLLLRVQVQSSRRFFTVSWKGSCKRPRCQQPRSSPHTQLQRAFRYAIRRQINVWRRQNNLRRICQECGKQSLRLQVDHIYPFIRLTQDFVEKYKQRHPDFQIPQEFAFRGGKIPRTTFKKSHQKFNRAWQSYHRKHARFQWLCRRCNMAKGGKTR